ncbi:MAG: hypothetical protein D6689_19505 [Deltaproteobacteria bacterium]|nr:MAG: hypothetical protein D6689_19505 [Deltaproteobacteria bacterium]
MAPNFHAALLRRHAGTPSSAAPAAHVCGRHPTRSALRRRGRGLPLAAASVRRYLAALALLAAAPSAARADDRPASTGPYAEGALGATAFVGNARSAAAVGPALGVRAGIDLWSWLSVGGHLWASTHEATVPPPPDGEYFQLYAASGDARLGFRVGRIAAFAQGGVGIAMVSSNLLERARLLDPGERFTLVFAAGGGLEYQLQNRHYAFGVAGEWANYTQFQRAQAVTVQSFLRYTF